MRALVLLPVLLALGCAATSAHVVERPPAPLAPRVVAFLDSGTPAFSNPNAPLARMLGDELRDRGFQVKRYATPAGSVPFGLELRGAGRLRCGEYGFEVDWIEIDVVDLVANERVAQVRGSGVTEGCLLYGQRGTLVGKLADELESSWAATPAP